MLEALAMAVWSATIGYFRLSVFCVPFVGFQVSTEDAISDTIHDRFLVARTEDFCGILCWTPLAGIPIAKGVTKVYS